ncbi:glucokinase [Prochlorococcus sp. MIT 1300]|uniref:glucokinase n=1 Tax=Prochlorococcus sp. MIT 1300 TaxID=3096218 RepID=UPI002A75AB3A|nr:glucokinase [Prochlorococcus sp. MIT 1300]
MKANINFLAGDLGGTKTLLAVYKWNGELHKLHSKKYLSAEWPSLQSMGEDFLKNLPSSLEKPTYGCIAVAGRVKNGYANITNLSWQLDAQEICNTFNLKRLELINDFEVLIFGLPFFKGNQKKSIQTSTKHVLLKGPVAIIGAGTGLGIARGLPTKNGLISLASEGGHREFAPRTDQEWLLANWIKKELGLRRLSVERVVSGNGLGLIALWRLQQSDVASHSLKNHAEQWGQSLQESNSNKRPDLPKMVSSAAKGGDPVMKEVLRFWLSAYGAAAGDLALQELCTGGLWIGGGTAQKNLKGLLSATFLDALREKGRFKSFVEELPVIALIDPEAGLFSAACRAKMLTESKSTLI